MSVRCAKCGEELMGAVNRCWKCGQMFVRRPDIDGQPPVRVDWQPPEAVIDAILLDEPAAGDAQAPAETASAPPAAVAAAAHPVALPPQSPYGIPRPAATSPSTAAIVEANRRSMIAMGGTVTSLVLGIFGLALAAFRFEGAVIAAIGLLMGLWGLYSRKRNWALVAMLLCALGITLGTYRGVRDLYIFIKDRQGDSEMPDPYADPGTLP